MFLDRTMITYIEAKLIAEKSAEKNLRQFCDDKNIPLLKEEYMVTEHAWLFFKNEAIKVPDTYSSSCNWSYAVSKKGELREFYDLPDKSAMKVVFYRLSEHFKENDL